MKRLAFVLTLAVLASSQTYTIKRPDTPYWKLVAEMERAGYKPFSHFEWSDENLEQMARRVPLLNNLRTGIDTLNVEYQAGGENEGYTGFTTQLRNKNIHVQVYYSKPSKNIDVALVLGHELIHAIHINDGLFFDWMNLVRVDQKRHAECMSEVGAYTWSNIYASDARTKEWIDQQITDYNQCFVSIRNLPANR